MPTNSWKLNNVQLNQSWVKEEIKKEMKDFLEFNENECTTDVEFSVCCEYVLSPLVISHIAAKGDRHPGTLLVNHELCGKI